MPDSSVVHIGENSQEKIAHTLLHEIMRTEGRVSYKPQSSGDQQADRKYLLDTYAECIEAVKGFRNITSR
jgi:hypothetical protein